MRIRWLSEVFAELERTTSRLALERTLAGLFAEADPESLPAVAYLVQGSLRPPYEGVELGVGAQLMLRAIGEAYRVAPEVVRAEYDRLGDLGSVAHALAPARETEITVREVYDRLLAIASEAGAGSTERRIAALVDLLQRLGDLDARYVVRLALGRLRLGVGEATLLQALANAFLDGQRALLERAYNLHPDAGWLAMLAARRDPAALAAITPTVGVPVRPALAERLPSAEASLAKIGPCQVEPKFDGLRVQIHRAGDRVWIYSRRLENLTAMLPEVVAAAPTQLLPEEVIVEGEALVYQPETDEFQPFQITAQRRRKTEIAAMAERYPLRVMLFDLLYACGSDATPRPLSERRTRLIASLRTAPEATVQLAEARVVATAQAMWDYFSECISRGLEGILAKRLDAPYQAGARNFNWIKLKRGIRGQLTDTVDAVIVGYLYGRGARARLGIGSLLTAVYDPETDEFLTVARVGSGPTEAEWRLLKERLEAIRRPGPAPRVRSLIVPDVWVEPQYVIEIAADEITRSPQHTAGRRDGEPGYALRFPRMIRFRFDKAPEDATTVAEIVALYASQRRQPTE